MGVGVEGRRVTDIAPVLDDEESAAAAKNILADARG
jgi:hypothetical protein